MSTSKLTPLSWHCRRCVDQRGRPYRYPPGPADCDADPKGPRAAPSVGAGGPAGSNRLDLTCCSPTMIALAHLMGLVEAGAMTSEEVCGHSFKVLEAPIAGDSLSTTSNVWLSGVSR